MMNKRKIKKKAQESGVALMMVLSSIAILTSMVVEFGYNSHITSTMAHNNLDRLKAHYLARSALGFAKLQIKIEKDIRKQLANYARYLAGVVGPEPICKLMPFSTNLLRSGFGLGGAAEPKDDSAESGSDMKFEGIMKAAAAGEFLSFDGDFSTGCDVEDKKVNLNYFWKLNPADPIDEKARTNAYESHKKLIESLLVDEAFNKYFEDDPTLRRDLVNNIADWVDQNNFVDESPGYQAGYEDQKYEAGDYSAKNGKFSTVDELLLIPGMGDNIFSLLSPNVTVYGDDKVNLCLAEDALVKAFVIRYSNVSPDLDPIYSENTELLENIMTSVRQACLTPVPKANEVANAIRSVLGLPGEAATSVPTGATPSTGTNQPTGNSGTQNQPTKVAQTLTEQILVDNRFYSFDLTGSSGDIILNIKAVLHTEDRDPSKWKLLYYRVQ